MRYSIKKKINFSFYFLVSIFLVNGIIIFWTVEHNNKLSGEISETIDPSLEDLNEFKLMLILSREFTINWVYLRSQEEYKDTLIKIQSRDYPIMKKKLISVSTNWENLKDRETLLKILNDFEKIILDQKKIMSYLSKFEDYDDPVKKITAESMLENSIIPTTQVLLNSLASVIESEDLVKSASEAEQENAIFMMSTLIIILTVTIIIASILLSAYMMKRIIKPINDIIKIVNELGKGVVKNVLAYSSKDEIGEMIKSVNALSVKLSSAALFAEDIGKRNFDSHFVPLSNEDNLGKALIAMRNNLRLSDQNLNDAQNKLILQNSELMKTNSELDKFVYSVSHDLRAPLSSMAGVVEIALDEAKEEIVIENLNMIRGSIKKLDGFILDILDYSRNARVEVVKEDVDLNEILSDVRENLKYMGKNQKNVRVDFTVSGENILRTDKSRLSIILNNLISNAIRYSNFDLDDPFVMVTVRSDEKKTKISVKDNGIGIEKDQQQKIFEMFYRVSKDSIGSGLGLYIVKECVTKLLGSISVVSKASEGTEFIVEIPHY